MFDTITSKPHFSHGPIVSAQPAPRRDKTIDDTAHLHVQLQNLGARPTGRTALVSALLDLQLSRSGIIACAAIVRRNDGTLAVGPNKSKHARAELDALNSWISDACNRAVGGGQTRVVYATNSNVDAICVPVSAGDLAGMVTLIEHTEDAQRRATETAVAQLVATQLDRWTERQRLSEMADQLARSAAIVELVQRVASVDKVKSACFTIAAALKDHLRCERVIIGLKRRGCSCRIVAVSGVAEVDPHSDESRRMKAAIDECLVRNELSAWPPLPGDNRTDCQSVPQETIPQKAGLHQLLAHRQLARRDTSVVGVPLKTLDGESIGALIIVGRREMAAVPQVAHFANSLGEPLGAALSSVQRAEGSRLQRFGRAVLARQHAMKRWIAAALVMAVAGVMMIPLPYKVACRSVIEPVERRFCVAPHDGLLESTLTEPGEVIQRGQLLARMDGREVRWELAGITADIERAGKKRDTYMANHATPDALLAELEMKRLDSRSKLLGYREGNLDITSPIEGIVLSGSLDRREHYPVTKGQVLYEIAPLDSLRVELGVPADDVTRVRPGMEVDLTFDGLGGEVFEGLLSKIRPRSEVRDEENVFIAEVVIDNANQRLRPGMMGRAKIVSERHTAGWILFHRPWEKAQTIWPW